jgi:hypothetical protein
VKRVNTEQLRRALFQFAPALLGHVSGPAKPFHNLCDYLENAVNPIRAAATQHVLDLRLETGFVTLTDCSTEHDYVFNQA